jgi:hypothetical protein
MIIAAIVFVASMVFAWTSPTQTPPNGNTAGPVNVSTTGQTKAGTFWAGIIVSDSTFCIGGSCVSSWPADSWTLSGTSVYYTGGKVGIGTALPETDLDVTGFARLAPQAAAPVACDAAHKGSIAVASGTSHICVCNGTSWIFNYNSAACVWN